MNVGFENPGHSPESKSWRGRGQAQQQVQQTESEKQWGKGRDVSYLGITRHIPVHHTTARLLLHFKALSYTRQVFWVQTTTEIIIQLPQPVHSFLSRRIIQFDCPRKGWNLCHFSLVIQWILEGTIGTHSTASWRRSWRNWKQLDLWSVFSTLFLVSPHCLKDSPSLCRHPQNSWDTHTSPLCILCPWNSCGGFPCSSLPSPAPSLDSVHPGREGWALPQLQTDSSKAWGKWVPEAPTPLLLPSPRCCGGRRRCSTSSTSL